MPSGITHMLLSRRVLDYIADENNDEILALLSRETGPFLLGSVAPDLPYLSVADANIFSNDTEIADDLHYKKTNVVPIQGLIRAQKEVAYNKKLAEELFAFYLGYCSHYMADGLVHPYVRDKVGDYTEASKEHRILEMKLDVFTAHKFFGVEVNAADFQEELDWMEQCQYKNQIFANYAELINSTYSKKLKGDDVQGWISAMNNVFSLAEGEFPKWYRNLAGGLGVAFQNYGDLKKEASKCLILNMPVDAEDKELETNFLGKDTVHFFEDVIEGYFARFPSIILNAYGAVFKNSGDIAALLPEIDFDTGRLVSNNELTETPVLWA